MSRSTPPSPAELLRSTRLGVGGIFGIVATAATPLAVCSGVVPTAMIATGQTGIPAGFVVVPFILGLFFVGLTSMAPRVPGPGMLYSYISTGLGRPLGAGAGAVSLLAYNALQVGLYGLIGGAAQHLLESLFSVAPPWWVTAVALWALVALLGPRKLKMVAHLLQAFLVLEVATLVVYGAANLTHTVDGIPWHTLSPTQLVGPGAAVVFLMAFLGYIGIESGAAYTRIARHGHRTVLIAMLIALVVTAVLYVLSTVGLIAAVGADTVVDAARTQNVGLMFEVARINIGEFAMPIGEMLLCTSIAAAALSLHATCNAHAYSLAGEGLLPKILSQVNHRTDQPSVASRAQNALGLLVIVLFAVFDWDPQQFLFYAGGTTGALCVLLLLTLTAVAIVVFFARKPAGLWRTIITPITAAALLLFVLVLTVWNFDTLLGENENTGPGLRWGILASVVLVLAAGVVRAQYLNRHDSEAYDRLGLGPAATSTTPSTAGQVTG